MEKDTSVHLPGQSWAWSDWQTVEIPANPVTIESVTTYPTVGGSSYEVEIGKGATADETGVMRLIGHGASLFRRLLDRILRRPPVEHYIPVLMPIELHANERIAVRLRAATKAKSKHRVTLKYADD